ncbi:DUF3027 domain-containing protein [Brachybacterium sp. SGAir0954]|uniref:DUF3027 domain-containing protein n=1 Tax=Brachybacterium sp. SGAir0954 TaxID=2571029 RepID=UPI0010CCCF5E|nr:DUF3027 domain-containing protein [Brachybacterium sp. SGAir0954]QCR53117.1 DUF3027 domain-containing protein [Brachybacterium sp. SGAir0954]
MTQPTTASRRPRTAKPKLDAVAAAAIEQAREALVEVTEPGQVGEHLRAEPAGERLVTHVFDCTMPGYRGWSWVVVLSRAPRAKAATVAETALLPGEGALLAPAWEPWAERLKPSDVGADDLLPFQEQDVRLEQGYEATGDEDEDRVAQWELGLGRERVLSPEGRAEAAERWTEGEFGPRQTSHRGRRGTVTATCSSCGFLSLLSGSLRTEFGVCTNEWSPADGRVVHLGYGCGSHSQTGQEETDHEAVRGAGVVIDELEADLELQQPTSDEQAADESAADESASGEQAADEPVVVDAPSETAADAEKADAEVAAADEAPAPGEDGDPASSEDSGRPESASTTEV